MPEIAIAQQPADDALVNGISIPLRASQTVAAMLRAPGEGPELILRVPGARRGSLSATLATSGYTLRAVVDDSTIVVSPVGQSQLPLPYRSNPLPAAAKIAPKLRHSGYSGEAARVLVHLYEDAAIDPSLAEIVALGGTTVRQDLAKLHAMEIEVMPGRLPAIAALPSVASISEPAADQILNFDARGFIGVREVEAITALDGAGVVVGVGDNGASSYHLDTYERTENFNPAGAGAHGSHVSGTVGGTGLIDPFARGMAPACSLLSHYFSGAWTETDAMRKGYGMNLTNNSYAAKVDDCGFAGTYDGYSAILDGLAQSHPDVLHVFAAGNDGRDTCSPYPPGYATLVGSYQTAKNVLTVGNGSILNLVEYNSSARGPVKDGRLKPELMGIGEAVYSTLPNNNYAYSWGTSMAAPTVTGALALLTQRYKSQHADSLPPAALLKALAMGCATDERTPGPDFATGFGLMNLPRSLAALDEGRYTIGSIGSGAEQLFSIPVPAGTGALRVTLYWPDVPGSPLSATALVNDLDLTLEDGASGTFLPLVLDPTPAGAALPAVPGTDHRNNVEQVLLPAPAGVTYTARVRGFGVPAGPQSFVLVWDAIPAGIQWLQPSGATAFMAGFGHKLSWSVSDTAGTQAVDYSLDNGTSWTSIAATLPGSARGMNWPVPGGISTGEARVRVTRSITGVATASETFVINPMPSIALSGAQCPGYMAVEWGAVGSATGYEVLLKKGTDLQVVDTVTMTSYVFSGLSTTEYAFAAVRPLFGSKRGYRSAAAGHLPNSGSCSGSHSDGDLLAEAILSPMSGREATSTALSASSILSVQLRNLDDALVSSYRFSYRLGSGSWQSQIITTPIAPTATALVTAGPLDLSAPGAYILEVAVENLTLTDPLTSNDTLRTVIRHLPNPPVALAPPVVEDFEPTGRIRLLRDTLGFTSTPRWDYVNPGGSGRLRTEATPSATIGGSRSVSLDAQVTTAAPVQNFLEGTFNLGSYSPALDEVRMEARYRLHGKTKLLTGNGVSVRGSDALPWLPVAAFDTTAEAGTVLSTGSVSLTDALLSAGQSFASSAGLRFAQRDTSVIAGADFGNGVTIDDIQLYTVQNDLSLRAVLSPVGEACGATTALPVTVRVYNGVTAAQSGATVSYRVDSGAVQTAAVPPLPGKDSVDITFSVPASITMPGLHRIHAWVTNPGDTYRANDSLLNVEFRNQPLIAQFPYLENFEAGDGFWYADGRRSTWEWGTPESPRIREAASGAKAWKTNLGGVYQNNERSYLISPCFDVSGLATPYLSFSLAVDLENCGAEICDAAWVEYSAGGGSWIRLGARGEGFNWYDNDSTHAWTTDGFVRWHVASIPLPTGLGSPLRLRFYLRSDGGVGQEGLAVDDIHIYDRNFPLYTGGSAEATAASGPGGSLRFTSGSDILAALPDDAGALGQTSALVYTHARFIDSSTDRYFLPRSFAIKSAAAPVDSLRLRLFVAEDDVVQLLADTSCPNCSKPRDAYRLGIQKYDDPDPLVENGSLADNLRGLYTFKPHFAVVWVPYDRGYYAETFVRGFSEFWFFDRGPSFEYAPADAAVQLSARRTSLTDVLCSWTSTIETLTEGYELQRSVKPGEPFGTVHTQLPARLSNASYSYVDAPSAGPGDTVRYRVKWRYLDGSTFYTNVRSIPWSAGPLITALYPNPAPGGRFTLRWTANPGTELQMQVVDAVGRIAYTRTLRSGAWDNETPVHLPGASGWYEVRCVLAGQTTTYKIIVR